MTIKVGDFLWTTEYGRPEHWREKAEEITGETPRSWLIGDPKYKRERVSKKDLLERIPNFGHRQWYTEQGKIDAVFIRRNRHQISSAVLSLKDVGQLKQIAEIIGMELT